MDAIRDAFTATVRRLRRVVLTLVSLAIGSAALVALVSLSVSSNARIAISLGALQPTTIRADLPRGTWLSDGQLRNRLTGLASVVSAGTYSVLARNDSPVVVTADAREFRVPNAIIASPQGLIAAGVIVRQGGLLSVADPSLDAQVLVGASVAREWSIATGSQAGQLTVNGRPAWPAGVAVGEGDTAVASTAVLLDRNSAESLGLLPATQSVVVSVDRGSVQSVARLLPRALIPNDPTSVSVSYAPIPALLTGAVASDSQQLVAVVATISALMAVLLVVASMQIAVWERQREIGILRSIGVSRFRVGLQFLYESAILGFLGALLGWTVAVLGAAGYERLVGNVFYMPTWLLAIPLIGALLGAVAGVLPSLRAARLDPIVLLRQ